MAINIKLLRAKRSRQSVKIFNLLFDKSGKCRVELARLYMMTLLKWAKTRKRTVKFIANDWECEEGDEGVVNGDDVLLGI